MTLFRIDFRVLSQNLSKMGPAGAVLGPCKVGSGQWAERFRLEMRGFLASFGFHCGSFAVNTKYSSIVVYKSYASDCMHFSQRRAQEHMMGGDESRCYPASCRPGSACSLRQRYAIP